MNSPLDRTDLLGLALAVSAAAAVFGPALQTGHTLQGGDLVLWVPQFIETHREGLFFPRWFPYFYAGLAQQFQFLNHAAFTMVLASPLRFHAVQFAVDVAIAGFGMWCVLRSWRLRVGACAIGALAYPLSNHLLTWVQAGHLWKFDTTCWTPWLLWTLDRGQSTGKLPWFAWAGAFLGLHLLGGDVQLAYYVGVVIALLTFGRWVAAWRARRRGAVRQPIGRILLRQGLGHALCVAIAIGFGAEVIHHYWHLLRTQEVVAGPADADRWRFSTEFSLPPEETLSLAVGGGVFGHTVDGPHYWGRARARNTDDYLGIVACCFALCAVYVRRDRRTFAWVAVAVVALLLSYGKYAPGLYRVVHALPFMSALRNPNRLLFVTAWATAILAALGADTWLRFGSNSLLSARLRRFCIAVAVAATVGGFVVVWQRVAPLWWHEVLYTSIARGGADAAEVAYRFGQLHAECGRAVFLLSAWLAVTCALFLPAAGRAGRLQAVAGFVAAVLVAGDLAGHARPFIRTYDAREAFVATPLVKALQAPPLDGRTKMWEETPALRELVNHRLPYFGIPSVDVISSRRPPEYTAVLAAWREGRLPTPVVLRLFHVTTILSAGSLPPGAVAADPVGVFDGVHVAAVRNAAPRAEVIGDFNVLAAPAILDRMAEPDFDPAAELLLEERPPVRLHRFAGPVQGEARLERDEPHRLAFAVSASRPAMLLVHDLYDSYWQATVDGKPAPILRANSFLRAVPVPEGEDVRVEMRYRPPRWPWLLTITGWIGLVVGAVCTLGWWWRREATG